MDWRGAWLGWPQMRHVLNRETTFLQEMRGRPAGVRAYIHMLKTRVVPLEATTQWVRDQV